MQIKYYIPRSQEFILYSSIMIMLTFPTSWVGILLIQVLENYYYSRSNRKVQKLGSTKEQIDIPSGEIEIANIRRKS